MFEKLLELLVSGWTALAPFIVIEPWQGGVVLRMGRYHRSIGEGFHWKWPLIEGVYDVPTCTTTMRLPPQTLTTKDGTGVVCAAVIKYAIRDPVPYVTQVMDQVDVLADVTMGAILTAVSEVDYEATRHALPERQVLESVRKQVNKYGFKVEAVTFTDFGKVRSFRLVQEHGANLSN